MSKPLPPRSWTSNNPKHNREYYFDANGNAQWELPSADLQAAAAPGAAAAPAAAAAATATESSAPSAAATPAAAMVDGASSDAAPAASGEERLFKKPKHNKNMRARPAASDGEESGSAVVRKAGRVNPMVQSTACTASARVRDDLSTEFAQTSDRRISNYDNKVFATNEQDTERAHDAQTQYEEAQQLWKSDERDADGKPIYRGQKAYKPYTAKAESFEGQVMNGAGPARAPVHYRATSRSASPSIEPPPSKLPSHPHQHEPPPRTPEATPD